jgi:hypothetical protein
MKVAIYDLKMGLKVALAMGLLLWVLMTMTGCNTMSGMLGGSKAAAANAAQFDEFDALRMRIIQRIADKQEVSP